MGCAESVPVESPAEVDRSAQLLLEWRGSTLGAAQPVRFAPADGGHTAEVPKAAVVDVVGGATDAAAPPAASSA